MIKNKRLMYIGGAIVIAAAIIAIKLTHKPSGESMQVIRPAYGSIQTVITSTAIVQPQNRLEIKPPINGRIEKILVTEGEMVKTGQMLALMSSTERAALLDAARPYGPEAMKYWEDVYKPTPLLAPIDGEVIVSKNQPGQTVTAADVVVVLSNHLIVQAQVDETDVGKVKIGQKATLSLDAYPQIEINGKVNHIYYESLTVNNVIIYQVDITPDEVPAVFRSGMSATVNIIENAKDDILTLPVGAVKRGKEGAYVLLSAGIGKKPEERKVEAGLSDDKNIEIISGLTVNDKVLVVSQKYKASSGKAAGVNPLSPVRRR